MSRKPKHAKGVAAVCTHEAAPFHGRGGSTRVDQSGLSNIKSYLDEAFSDRGGGSNQMVIHHLLCKDPLSDERG
jgi:hypothetical protein